MGRKKKYTGDELRTRVYLTPKATRMAQVSWGIMLSTDPEGAPKDFTGCVERLIEAGVEQLQGGDGDAT